MIKLNLSPSYLLLIVFATVFATACKKDISEIEIEHPGGTTANNSIPAYVFNWETTDFMPTPTPNTIYVPWANGAVKGFPSDIWYDTKASDGWQLVYNQFNPNLPLPNNPFFVLYNQYRGLLRIYIYVTSNGFLNSTYLTDGLNLSPNVTNSHMLNFIGQDIVDVDQKKQVVTKIENTQMATGVWYASQYEIAYDPNIASATYQQTGLNWTLKWTNITTVDLEGGQQGTLKGTITTPASSFNLGGTLASGALQAAGLSVFDNNAGPDPDHPGIGNHLGLPGFVFDAIKDGLSSGLGGVVKNIFNGIFGGNSNNTQQVNLTLNTKITLTGSLSQGGALIPDPGLGLGVPGTSNSQTAPGLIPNYNAPMGVMYITGKPTVNVQTTIIRGPTRPQTVYSTGFSLVQNSFQVIYNPAVLNNAQIQNYQQDVVLIDPPGDHLFEIIGTHRVANLVGNGGTYNITAAQGGAPIWGTPVGIRISFDVVPNNGAPRSKIVKTFLANRVGQ